MHEPLLVITDFVESLWFLLYVHMRKLLSIENPDFPRDLGLDNIDSLDTQSTYNMDTTEYVPRLNQTWSEGESSCSFADLHIMPDLITASSGFEWNSNFKSLGLWQLNEGAINDALFPI
jgi:hypothetical protein